MTKRSEMNSSQGSRVPADLFNPPHRSPALAAFTRAELRRTEKVLGVRLPAAYVEVLKFRNGGSLHRKRIVPAQRPTRDWGSAAQYELESIAGIHPTHWDSLTSYLVTARTEWDLPEGLVPFAGDGHYWVCLDYRTCGPRGEPSVTHTLTSDTPGKAPREFLVAKSFDALISGLQGPKPGSGDAWFALDTPGVRATSLARLLRRLGCTRYRWPGLISSKLGKPPAWEWPKYKGGIRGQPAFLSVLKNRHALYAAYFSSRKVNHPILRVVSASSSRDACIRDLASAFGNNAVLLARDSPGWDVPSANA